MFIASDNELREFTSKLLEHNFGSDVLKTLREEDQKQLRFVKISLKERMPKQLHSSKLQTGNTVCEAAKNDHFPRMLDSRDKKTYEYINDDLHNIKQVASTYTEMSKMSGPSVLSRQNPIQPIQINQEEILNHPEEKQQKVEEQKQIRQTPPPGQTAQEEKSRKSRPASHQPSKRSVVSNTSPNPFVVESKKNPFINKNLNFTDSYANSKTLQGKYSHLDFTQNSRNLAAIVQSSKFTAFQNSGLFPTAVLPGVILAPRETTFSKQAQLDVEDVMRYTLGVNRSSQNKPNLQNPFHRPPKKRKD